MILFRKRDAEAALALFDKAIDQINVEVSIQN